MKKVSIIIPTYNQDKYISKAIESALAQDYSNIEIVLSDDGSKDNTLKIAKKYQKDKKFKYLRNKKNLGRVGNYHKALYDYATGDYALFLDGDDYLIDFSYISKAMKLMEENDLVMVFAKQKVYIEYKNKFVKDKMNNRLPKIIEGNWLFQNYPKGYSIPHLSTLYNRKYAMQIGYYEKNILSSDWESVLRIILNNKIGFIDSFVGVWRKHEKNESKSRQICEIMNNVGYIEGPYKFCLDKNLFTKKILDKWRLKMLKRFFIKNLITALLLKDKNLYEGLSKKIQKYDLKIYKSLKTDLRLILIKIILKSSFLTRFVFKYIIKQESYLEDVI